MVPNDNNKNIDEHTGIETTGHEWDGIKELNNPSPRWWVWLFLATIVWAIGYWYVYPAVSITFFLLPHILSFAPNTPNRCAIDFPRPVPPPVIITVLFFRRSFSNID